MKTLLIIIDGIGDDELAELGGRTPFNYARHEQMDRLAAVGCCGEVTVCGEDIAPESLGCILRLLGVPRQEFPANRSYLELLANERDVSEYEMVLRCNLVALDGEGKLLAFNGEGLSAHEMRKASLEVSLLQENVEFVHLSTYRNLLILDKEAEILQKCHINPPHESMGENIAELLSELNSKSLRLKVFMEEANKVLVKYSHGDFHYVFYPWGPAERQQLKSFHERHKLAGGAVCGAEIVKGIARSLKMVCPELVSSTGDIDTDLAEKAAVTLELLKEKDFVLAHFNGTDEAAHRHDYLGKADFITRIDEEYFGRLLAIWGQPLKILVCGDHATSSLTGRHTAGKVPFIASVWNGTYANQPAIEDYKGIVKFLFEGR